MRIDGRRTLLTGASGGIGHAIARALHARGAELLLTARRVEVLEALRDELGERVEIAAADLARSEDVARLAERAAGTDVLVANAALPASGRLEDYTAEQIDRALDVNLRAPIQLARALLPEMLARGDGHLVLINSMSGKIVAPGSSLYSATKFGLRGFAAALREDVRGAGIGVTSVFPGFVSEAGMWAEAGIDLPRGIRTKSPEQVADAVVRGIETGRHEIEVAGLAVRVGGWVAGVAPGVVSAVNRRMGADEVAGTLAESQRSKR